MKKIKRYKYPRTFHFPFSSGISSDDKVIKSSDTFKGKNIVITVKMDGECTTVYPDGYIHARSLDGISHPSRNWVKNFFADKAYFIPEDHRICGENFFAVHSIKYGKMDNYFQAFSVWKNNICLSFSEATDICESIGIPVVSVLYHGPWISDIHIEDLALSTIRSGHEGIVVRVEDEFTSDQFSTCVAKFVRANHVKTNVHWKNHWIAQDQ